MVVTKGWGEGGTEGELLFNGYSISVLQDESPGDQLHNNGNIGNSEKMVRMVNFMLYVSYHNKRNGEFYVM